MRILYLTTLGGTMSFFKSLIKELVEQGDVVDIATNVSVSDVPECFYNWGCKVYSIPSSRSPFSIGNLKAIKTIKKIAKDYDIVHCHTPLVSFSTRLACKGLRKKGIKVIYTAHGFHFYKGAPLKNWLLYYPIEVMCSRWTDVLITINNEDYQLAKRKMKATTIKYVPGVGVDIKRFSDTSVDRNKKRDEIGVPRDCFMIMSVGELNENKNHQIIIRAIAQLEEKTSIFYCVAGNGNQGEKLLDLAKVLNVHLKLLGYRRDIPELYHASDLCAFPSIREGLGLSAIEGMACSIPVVCSINRGTKEYLDEGVVGCNYSNVNEFSIAIKRLLNDSIKRNEMGKKNQKFSERFDYSIVNSTMKKIYNDTIR